MIEAGFVGNTRIGKEFNIDQDFYRLLAAMAFAHEIMQSKTLTQVSRVFYSRDGDILMLSEF